jgi:RHS repeat-associated protein
MASSISQRDGAGRPLAVSTTVNGTSALGESLTWTGDGLLATHTLARPDYTNYQSYSYAPLSRRLTQEIVGLSASATWTNAYVYDSGMPGGPGVLTSTGEAPGATNVTWNGGTDAFSRINAETNSVAQRQAYGQVNGIATVTALLDGKPMPVTTIGTNALQWRAELELLPGAHQLIVNAVNWSGYYTASATNTFTNNAADRVQEAFSGDGEVTNRVWVNSSNQTIRTQSLSWDAKGRLHSVIDLDNGTNGFTWAAVYDPLGRRLQTTTIMVTNGVSISSLPQTISQYYDPGVEFLELAVAVNGVLTYKVYGPDANGAYGGMNGVGGLEAVDNNSLQSSPIVSDIRGNGLALFNVPQGSLNWFPSRLTAYGAVPGYRPLPLGEGADLAAASAWRGKWADITDNYQLGWRPYKPAYGRFIAADPFGHSGDFSLYAFCAGGDPINYFDPDGRLATQVGREVQTDWNALPQFALNVGNNVEQGNNDFWTGAFNSAGGLANAAAHPINTTASAINGAATLAANLTVDPSGTVNNLYNGFANNFNDPNRASQFFGSLTFGVETTIAGGAAFRAISGAGDAGVAAEGTVGKTIGLGLDEDLMNLRGTGAITYKNAGWQQAGLTTIDAGRATESSWFRMSFNEASQNAGAIRFDVSSFNLAYPKPGMTSWELNQVVNNPALLGKTTFMQNGGQVLWNGTGFVKP